MYTFESRSGKSLTLRPEGTAPAIRAYVQHRLGANLPLSKIYYVGRLFRYERPQAGRYREHTQLGIEAIGSADPALDAEVISLAERFFKAVGIKSYELKLNSIGCPECRPRYKKALVDFASKRLQELCASCAQRYEQNPLRMLDCKEQTCVAILQDAPRMTDFLCDDCAAHFSAVKDCLAELGLTYTLDPKLVRGFDYYTRTAFEFVSSQLGAQNAIGGGGRYDNLVEEIGGPATPAIGFGLGLDRLMLALDALGVKLPVRNGVVAFVAGLGEAGHEAAIKVTANLRLEGVPADMDYTGRSLKAQLKVADRLGAAFAVILGEDEIANNVATLRDLRSSQQTRVPLLDLAKVLKIEDLD